MNLIEPGYGFLKSLDHDHGYHLVHRKKFEYERFLKNQGIRVAYAFFHVLYQVVEGNYSGNNTSDLYNNNYSFSSSPASLESEYIMGQYGIAVGKLLLNKVTEETFDGANALTEVSQYYYNTPGYLQPYKIVHTNSKGSTIRKTIKYPYDFNGIYSQMITENMIDLPIEIIKTNTSLGKEISRKKTNYAHIQAGLGFFAPVSLQSSYGGAPLVTDVSFDQYDQYGNILQRTLRNGVPVSYLWGYNDLYPVAKLAGVKYSQIPSSFLSNVQINNPSSDGALRSVLDNLRGAFSGNEQISTYTYKRLTGTTSETTPNNYTTYYEYDPIGRLINQKDNDQHVMKHYSYNMTGPTSNSLSPWYVNYPMMETYNEDCGNDHYVTYNYIVPGGTHTGYSQDMADEEAESDLATDYTPPDPSPCSTGSFVTASIKIMGDYFSVYGVYSKGVIIDFLQNGSIIASCHVPFFAEVQRSFLEDKILHLPPGAYQLSFRSAADTRYADVFLCYYFYSNEEGTYTHLYQGDYITIEANHHYEFIAILSDDAFN